MSYLVYQVGCIECGVLRLRGITDGAMLQR